MMRSLEANKKYKQEKKEAKSKADKKKKLAKARKATSKKKKGATRKRKSGRKTKTEKRKLSEKLLKLAKEIVYKRDKDTCQHCMKKVSGSNRHASHVIPVSRDGRLKYDILNMKVLCYHCHLNWRHKHPIEAGERYTKKFPERWKYLSKKYQVGPKGSISIVRLQELYDEYKSSIQ